jgi:hypothetical protein
MRLIDHQSNPPAPIRGKTIVRKGVSEMEEPGLKIQPIDPKFYRRFTKYIPKGMQTTCSLKKRRVYKVVREKSPVEYCSIWINDESPLHLTYRIGEATIPYIGGLFGFTDLLYANNWASKMQDFLDMSTGQRVQILEGIAQGTFAVNIRKFPQIKFNRIEELSTFWEKLHLHGRCYVRSGCMRILGTTIVSVFTPTRVLTDEERRW